MLIISPQSPGHLNPSAVAHEGHLQFCAVLKNSHSLSLLKGQMSASSVPIVYCVPSAKVCRAASPFSECPTKKKEATCTGLNSHIAMIGVPRYQFHEWMHTL